jgi:hypothetical protein
MSGKDRDKDAPSLEPPTLFGRKRRTKNAPETPAVPEATRVDLPAVEPDVTPTAVVEHVPEPAPKPAPKPVVARRPEPTPEPAPEPVVARTPEPTQATPAPVLTEQAPTVQAPTEQAQPVAPPAPREPREPREPFVTGMPAACLTGALVGLATVGLTWLGLRACEVARGTSSCGNPGFLLLIAILVAMVLAGTALLRTFRVAETSSTSFLAVGLLTVLVLLFLIEALFSWTMVIVIPLLAVGCFAASHWVTTLVTETDTDD